MSCKAATARRSGQRFGEDTGMVAPPLRRFSELCQEMGGLAHDSACSGSRFGGEPMNCLPRMLRVWISRTSHHTIPYHWKRLGILSTSLRLGAGTPARATGGRVREGGRYLPARAGRGLVHCAPVPCRRDAVSDPVPRYFGPEEAAEYLGLSPKTLQRMSDILDAEQVLFRQVWYKRHMNLRLEVESGERRIITNEEFVRRDDQPESHPVCRAAAVDARRQPHIRGWGRQGVRAGG